MRRNYLVPKEKCYDCNVNIGEFHVDGCDIEICPECGGQWISCECEIDEDERIPYDGYFPGTLEAIECNLYSRWDEEKKRWIKCSADDMDAGPDLNRIREIGTWDKKSKKWVVVQ
ncbi:MAG: hypothetical protein AABY32_01015 [Nanoarchaeota archaeon]